MSLLNLIEQLKSEIAEEYKLEQEKLVKQIAQKEEIINKLVYTIDECKKQLEELHKTKQSIKNYEKEKDTLHSTINSLKVRLNKLTSEKEQITGGNNRIEMENNIIVVEDPRQDNKSLPNDSTITYAFGARAYVTDLYPGYIWRNCEWFKIKHGLKFKPQSETRIKRYMFSKNNSGHINDAYVPIIINGIRYFILYKYCTNNDDTTYVSNILIYYPSEKKFIIELPKKELEAGVIEDKFSINRLTKM